MINPDYKYPEGSSLIEDQACEACGMNTLYDFPDISENDKRFDKNFCACEKCYECSLDGISFSSTPENLCEQCYCPICGVGWYFIIDWRSIAKDNIKDIEVENQDKMLENELCDRIDNDTKIKYKQEHLATCEGDKTAVFKNKKNQTNENNDGDNDEDIDEYNDENINEYNDEDERYIQDIIQDIQNIKTKQDESHNVDI